MGAATLVEWRVRLPPLGEQRGIVDALDSYLTRLDAAEAALERVQVSLKRYRASVLQAAVEGRLVPTEAELARREGRDYEPASVLLERILAERRRRWEEAELARLEKQGKRPKGDAWKAKYVEPAAPKVKELPALPEGWCWATLDQFFVGIEAGKNFKCLERPPNHDETGVVKVSSVTWGTFDQSESKTCTRPELVDARLFVRQGDFLFSRANTIELVGACVIVERVALRLMLSDKILRFRTVGEIDEWLLQVLRSPLGRAQIEALATGNQESMRNIGQARIRAIAVPLPPLVEVNRITEQLERHRTIAESAELAASQNARRTTRLRQSILNWAFQGKLVDQDPSDEPAAVLLVRIRTEREAALHASGKRRAKPKSPHARRRASSGDAEPAEALDAPSAAPRKRASTAS